MRRAVVVKLGSSTLVDGRRRLRRARLSRLASELVALQLTGTPVCVVSSGAIALGLGALERDVRPSDVPGLQAASAVGQGLLAGAWQRALAAAGGRAAQVLLTADDVRRRTSYLNARATLEALLAWDVVPIVNENDSTATDEITFGDNDALAAQVALLLRARLLVLLTDAEGLYTRDPRARGRRARARGARSRAARRARPRRRLRERPRLGRHALEGRRGVDGGGRRRRLRDRLGRAAGDDRARRGRTRGRARASRAARRPVSAWKLWLRYGKPPGRARVRRRRGAHARCCRAARACCRSASSAWRGASARATPCACARSTARRSRRASWPWAAPSCDARPGSTRPSPGLPRPFIAITWFSTMAVTTESASTRARAAARTLATLGRGAKDAALEQIALAIERDSAAIVEANAEDLAAARASGQSSALLDRLTLDAERVLALCDAVRAVAALDDPVGEVVTGWRLPNGLDVQKVRVPLGVLLVVYEARPNVTVDVASLCLKSGNACLLRGSTSARAHERRAPALRARRPQSRRPARGRGRAARGDARGAGRDRRRSVRLRRRHPARRRGAQEVPARARARAGARRRGRQLPRLPARGRRSRQGAADRDQRQDAAARRLQRLRDPARASRRAAAARARSARSWPSTASSCARIAEAAAALGRAEPACGRGRLGDRVPRPGPRGAHRRLGGGGDRAHRALLDRATPRRS